MKRRERSAKKKPVCKKALAKLERLKGLLEEAKKLESMPQEKSVKPEPSLPKPQQVELSFIPFSGSRRAPEPVPDRLKGYSLGDILLMQADGELNPAEEAWLNKRHPSFR